MLATLYVDNPADFIITTDQGNPGLDDGDIVVWNPGAGSQHGLAVAGLVYGSTAFGSIQAAVNAANAAGGDTIRIAPGTFSELVSINKSVSVLGNQVGVDGQTGRPGASETIVNGTAGTSAFVVSADDVELNGLLIRDQTNVNQFGAGVVLSSGVSGTEFRNNIVQINVVGLFLANDSATNQAVIERNLFRDNDLPGPASGSGIYSDQFVAGPTLTNVLIANNTFISHDGTGAAINLSSTSPGSQSDIAIASNVFDFNSRALVAFNLVNSSFTGNEVTNSTFTGSADLRLFNGVSNFAISNNVLRGTGADLRAVRISDIGVPGGDANNITFTQNSISGYGNAGLEVDAGAYSGTLDATFNWWGAATGPTTSNNPVGTGQTIVDPDGVVAFSPFLSNGTDAQPAVRGFQPLTPPPLGIVVTGTDDADELIVTATSADDGSYQLITGGVPGPVVPFTDVTVFSFAAGGGNDVLTINNPAGGLFAPAGGIFYFGGAQSGVPGDRLEILGGAHTSQTHTFLPASGGNRGTIALVNGGTTATISYTGLEPVLVNAGTPNDIVFNLPTGDGNNNATLGDDGLANGLSQISGTGFETTTFANPSNSLTVNVGNDGETFTLATLDAAFAATVIHMNGGTAAEVFNIQATPASAVTNLNLGGGAADTINVSSDGAALSGNLNGLDGVLRIINPAPGSASRLNISESGTAEADTIIYDTAAGSISGTAGGGWQIELQQSTLSGGVNLSLGSAGDTVHVRSIAAGEPLTISGNGGADTVNAGSLANSLDSFLAGLTFNAGGQVGDTLNINDQGDATNNTYTVTATQVTRSGGPTITYSGVNSLALNAGTGNDTVNLNSTAAGTVTAVNAGGGNDSIVFANGVSLNGGTIDGGTGVNTLNYSAYTSTVVANLGLGVTGLVGALQGEQEVPAKDTPASGTATVSNYDPVAKTFDISITVTDLDPNSITGFHIHRAPFNVNGPIIIDFAPGGVPIAPIVPVGTGFTFSATGVQLPAQHEAAFLGGITYVNVHTPTNPGGEIRGQLFSTGNVNLPSGTATGTGGISNIQNVLGGTAADSLVGSFAANSISGNAGNDTIVGGPGSDTMSGDAGDDVIVWSNGDGTDVIDGGAGSDRVQVNGNVTAADEFTIGAGPGGRVDFDRLSPGPFSLDIGTIETLSVVGVGGDDIMTVNSLVGVANLTTINLAGLDGNDLFNVNPTTAPISINVQGHQPVFPALPGDTLNYIGPGTVFPSGIGGGTITQPGFQDVTFSNLERLTGGPFDVFTPGAIDVFNNKVDGSIVTVRTEEGQVSIDADVINTLTPGNGVVNMIGDNDDTIDQTDNFVVVGTGPNAFTLSINGSAPVQFTGVTHLNVIGHELVDTLEITPFADNSGGLGGNQPRGWGIDVFFDEGLPNQTDGAQQDSADLSHVGRPGRRRQRQRFGGDRRAAERSGQRRAASDERRRWVDDRRRAVCGEHRHHCDRRRRFAGRHGHAGAAGNESRRNAGKRQRPVHGQTFRTRGRWLSRW
jgi:hypothetical protein